MRLRPIRLLLCLLLAILLTTVGVAASADHHETATDDEPEEKIEDYTGGSVDPNSADAQDDDTVRERLGTMSEIRFGSDTNILSRVPWGLDRWGDLLLVRPVTISLGIVSGMTYGIAVGPTLVFDPDSHDKLQDDLLIEPWRLLWKRPLGGPLDFRARDVADVMESEEIPIE